MCQSKGANRRQHFQAETSMRLGKERMAVITFAALIYGLHTLHVSVCVVPACWVFFSCYTQKVRPGLFSFTHRMRGGWGRGWGHWHRQRDQFTKISRCRCRGYCCTDGSGPISSCVLQTPALNDLSNIQFQCRCHTKITVYLQDDDTSFLIEHWK